VRPIQCGSTKKDKEERQTWASPSDNISVDADRGRKSPGDAVTVRTASCRFIGGFSVSSGDASLAEDLTSGVFVDVWCHAGSFEGRSTVATWLLAIARYKALFADTPVTSWTRRARLRSRIQPTIRRSLRTRSARSFFSISRCS
jgi:hypothetical protein